MNNQTDFIKYFIVWYLLRTVESFYNLCKSEAENIRRYFKQKRTKYQTHFLQVECV